MPHKLSRIIRISPVFLILFCTIFLQPLSAETVALKDAITEIQVGLNIDYLEDGSGKLTIEQAASVPASRWRKSKQKYLNFGISKSAFWIRFDLKNKSSSSDWVVQSGVFSPDEVQLFVSDDNGGFSEERSGSLVPMSARGFKSRQVVLPLHSSPGTESTVFMRVMSDGGVECQLSLLTRAALLKQEQDNKLLLGIFFGIMLIMAFYNFSLLLSIRDTAYLWYVLHVLCGAACHFALEGFLFEYVVPENPGLTKTGVLLFGSLGSGAATLVVLTFLNLKANAPRFRYVAIIMGVYGVLALPVGLLFGNNAALAMNIPGGLLGPLIVVTASILAVKKGYKPARYFLAAWASFVAALFIYILAVAGAIDFSFIVRHGLQLGLVLEVFLISQALGYRYKVMRQEKETAQKHLIEKQNETILLNDKIAVQAREKAEILARLESFANPARYISSKIKDIDVDAILVRINHLFEKEGLFRDESLTLSRLAGLLDINQHQLSEVLNSKLNLTFRQFLLHFRAREARRLIMENPDKTILEIAFESGFNSKTAFNGGFKKVFGLAPTEFRGKQSEGRLGV